MTKHSSNTRFIGIIRPIGNIDGEKGTAVPLVAFEASESELHEAAAKTLASLPEGTHLEYYVANGPHYAVARSMVDLGHARRPRKPVEAMRTDATAMHLQSKRNAAAPQAAARSAEPVTAPRRGRKVGVQARTFTEAQRAAILREVDAAKASAAPGAVARVLAKHDITRSHVSSWRKRSAAAPVATKRARNGHAVGNATVQASA